MAAASTEAEAPVLAEAATTRPPLGSQPPPIPERIRVKIRRGEYVHLSMLLQANLATARESCSESTSERARMMRESASLPITEFTGWAEAWSAYSAV